MKTGPEIKWERSNHQHTQKLEYIYQSILPLRTVYMDGMKKNLLSNGSTNCKLNPVIFFFKCTAIVHKS